jgi:predicted ArsR family transcriptional regulator
MCPRGRTASDSDEDIVRVARELPDPVFSAQEVAKGLTIGETRTKQRLDDLVNRDVLRSKRFGSGTAYWFPGP